MTEREVRIAGSTSQRLRNLRGILRQGVREGSLAIRTNNGAQSFTLYVEEVEALLDLLIERDEMFLTGLNIELESSIKA
jgi:hypothetical protein